MPPQAALVSHGNPLTVFARVFSSLYSLGIAMRLYRLLTRRRKQRNEPKSSNDFADLGKLLADAPAASLSAFVAAALGAFVAGRRLGLSAGAAGAAAGLALQLAPPQHRSQAALRALVLALDLRGCFSTRATPPTALFMLSAWSVMSAWFFYPTTLPRSYCRWIDYMSECLLMLLLLLVLLLLLMLLSSGEMDPRIIRVLRYLYHGKVSYGQELNAHQLDEYAEAIGAPSPAAFIKQGRNVPCHPYVHPESESCAQNARRRFTSR